VATGENSPLSVAAEGGRLVADALTSRVFDLAEALHADPADAAKPSGARASPAESASDAEHGLGGAVHSLASSASRAAADAASTIAASVVPAVVERLDVNALLAKVDVNALVARVDIDGILDSVDPNPLLERVDVDALVQKVDVGAIAGEALEAIDVGDLIQESTASMATDTLEAIRVQAIRGDDLLARAVDWTLRRRRPRDTALERPGGP
jgi:hypothetical protein